MGHITKAYNNKGEFRKLQAIRYRGQKGTPLGNDNRSWFGHIRVMNLVMKISVLDLVD